MSETQTNGGELQHRIPPALPETRVDLLAQYKLKRKPSINDIVANIIVRMWEIEEFQKLVDAIYDSDAVTGSLGDDDVVAAQMIMEFAKREKIEEVSSRKLHTIKLAMRVALRRYNQGRTDRYEQAELPGMKVQQPEPAAPAQ